MKVRLFVPGSAALLAVWLGATYVHEIPAKDYPELGRHAGETAAAVTKPASSAVAEMVALKQPSEVAASE